MPRCKNCIHSRPLTAEEASKCSLGYRLCEVEEVAFLGYYPQIRNAHRLVKDDGYCDKGKEKE